MVLNPPPGIPWFIGVPTNLIPLQRSFHERFINQNSEEFFYTIHTKMAKAIVDIKNCHATASTDTSGQANTKNRVDDIQVRNLKNASEIFLVFY